MVVIKRSSVSYYNYAFYLTLSGTLSGSEVVVERLNERKRVESKYNARADYMCCTALMRLNNAKIYSAIWGCILINNKLYNNYVCSRHKKSIYTINCTINITDTACQRVGGR